MARTKLPQDMTVVLGAPGETLISTYNDEERRIDFLTIQDYRTMVDNDGQVQMLINAINNTILSAGIEIVDPETYDSEEASEEKQFIEKNLFTPSYEGGMTKSLELVNRIMLRAFIEGFRVFEVVYKLGDDRKIYLDRLAPRAGLTDYELYLLADDKGDFYGIRQRTAFKNKIVDVKITNDTDIAKVVKATFGEEYGSLYGRSGLKAAWYHYDKGHKGMYLNHVGHELGTQKVRYIRHKGASEEQILAAVNAAARFTNEAVIALDDNIMTIETLELSSADVMRAGKENIDLHYSMIAKSVLAQFIDLGNTETGSRALGDSQIKFFKQGLESVARIILEDTWNKVIADLCKVNFGRGIYPRFKVKPISDTKIELLHTMFGEMIKKGTVNEAIVEKIQGRVAEDLGLDISEEEMQEATEKSEQAQQEKMQSQPTDKVEEDSVDAGEKHSHVHLEDNLAAIATEAIPRMLFADEEKVKWMDIKRELDTAEQQAMVVLGSKLSQQKNGVVDAYTQAIRSGRKAISNVKIELAENTYSEELMLIVLKLMEYGKIAAANELLKSVPQTKAAQRVYIEDKVNAAIQDQETRLQLRLSSVANTALISGMPENQASLLLEQEYDDFFQTVLRPTVGALLPSALNWGRQISFEKYANDIFAYRYSAVLDNRTTEYCKNLDGKVFQASDPDYVMLTPPNHFNCRSIWTPILKSESAGVKIDGKPNGVPVYGSISSFAGMPTINNQEIAPNLASVIQQILDEQ